MARAPVGLQALLALPDDDERLEKLLLQAWERRRERPQEALAFGRRASALAEQMGHAGARARAVFSCSVAHFARSEYAHAQKTALEGLRLLLLEPEADPLVWEEVLGTLSGELLESLAEGITSLAISTFRLAQYPTALLFSSKELHLRRHLGDRQGEAKALHGMGWGYSKVGLYRQALEHHFRALGILEEVAPNGTASPLNGLAATCLDLGHYEQALEYSRRAIDVAEEQPNNAWPLSTALRNIGLVHQRLGDYQAAREFFERSLSISDGYGVALNHLSLGEMYLEQGAFEAALEHFRTCLAGLDGNTRRHSRAQALTGIGNVHLAHGDPRAALGPLHDAQQAAEKLHAPVEIYRAHHSLARAYKALGDPGRALDHFEAFHRYREAVVQEISDVRSKVLMVEFDVERLHKDQEIHRLRNVELAQAFEELQKLHRKLEVQARKLEHLSNLDGLTGLFNRRYLDRRLEEEVARSSRYHHPLSLLMCDIDDFKQINDRHTHIVGDEVLRVLAGLLQARTRETDVVARFGGEELVVILPETSLGQAVEVGRKIRQAVADYPWEDLDPSLEVTISIGAAEWQHGLEDLLRRADEQLYRAKAAGKNRVCD